MYVCRNFFGLASGDGVPDAKTVWTFKEQLMENKDIVLTGLLIDSDDKARNCMPTAQKR